MRDLNREAWFLYTVTSPEWFEQAAQACETFAHVFNGILTSHGAHGHGRFDYWAQKYLDYAQRIRRCAELVQTGDDYMPMLQVMSAAPSDYRGIIEQPLGWMSEADDNAWKSAFERMSMLCGLCKQALENIRWGGDKWLDRGQPSEHPETRDRDDGHVGDLTETFGLFQASGVLPTPEAYPIYTIDHTLTCKPGERCPRSGVWVPAQGLDNYSLAFAMAGRAMQPAFEIVAVGEHVVSEEFDIRTYSPVTKARDTTWYAVFPLEQVAPDPDQRIRRNVPADQPCPETGYWFTPAKPDSRRKFQQGDIFPNHATAYGATLWQWSPDQSNPKL